MAFRVVEGTFEMQGTVSGTDATTVVLTDPTQFPEHTSPNILRIWVENPSTCPDVINNIFNGPFTVLNTTASGSNVQIVGAGEVSVTTAGDIITVSGTPHSAGGSPAENALIGVDGITVISGVNTTTISGFLGEFVSASGSLQTQINNIDSSVTLQEAYDNGDGTILTTGGSKPVLISGTVIASGTDGKFIASDGSFTFPSYTFEGDTSTGFYLAAAGAFGITAGGSNSLFLTTSEVQAIDPLRVPVGSQASPGIRFAGDANTGFYSPGADVIGLTVGNSTELTVSGTDTGNSGVGIQTKLTTVSGIFTESLTVSGSPVCIDCPDFSQFATITELVTTSGHLQTQIDSINVDEIEPAIVGDNGIVVTSGVDTTTVQASGTMALTSGTYTESLTVSGTPVELAGAVDLQVAYDNSADGHIAIPPGIGQKPISISGSFSGFDHGLVLGGQDIIDFSFSDIPSVLSIYGEASFGHFTIRGLAPGAQPQFFGTTARGSFDAPQMSQGGDVAFSMGGIAHDGDNYASISAIQSAVAAPVVSGSDIIEGRLVFSTTDSTGNQNSVMSIHSTESVSINETNPGIVDPYALYVVGSGIFTDDLVVNDDFSADTGAFTTSLTVSGSPVCINCPDFSTFATLTDLTTTSGHLQNQIDSINVDEIEPAIVGVDGITVISGSNTTVSGFRTEFVSASGSLQSQIDGIDPNVTLQDAYDDGNDITIAAGRPVEIDGSAETSIAALTFNGSTDYPIIQKTIFGDEPLISAPAGSGGFTTTLLTATGTPNTSVIAIESTPNLTGVFRIDTGNVATRIEHSESSNEAYIYPESATFFQIWSNVQTDVGAAGGGLVSINRDQVTGNFRMYSTSANDMMFGDFATGRIGIGTDLPGTELSVLGTISGTNGQFEDSLTVSGSPVCIDCPDFSQFATTAELVTVSGHLQTQIDAIDSSVTLQDAYDNGNTITTVSGSPITIDGAADSSNGLIDLDVTGMQGGIRNSVFSSTVPLISSASTIGQTLTLLEMDETVQNEVRIDIAGNLFSTFSLTDGSAGNILDIAIAEVAATTFITPTLPILLLQSGATDGANVSSIRLAPATGGEIFLNPNAVDIDTHINAAGVQPAFYVDGASGNVGIRTDMPWCELTVVSGMCVSGTGSAYTFIDENLVTVVSGIQISAHGAHPVVSSPALNTGTTVLYSATNEVSSNTIRVEMGASDIASFILTQNTAGDANISMSVSDFFGATSIVGDGAFTIANNNNATMALASTADLTLRGATGSAVWVNPLAEDVDFRVSGDNDLDLIYANAAVDRVGIGTEVPGEKLSVEGTISGSTLKTGDGNVEGLIEDQSGMIDLPVGKNYTLVQSAKYDFTIDEITHQTVAGTCSGTLTINGTAIEGMDNLIMNSSETTSTATASFTVTAGDRVQLAISGTSDAEDLAFTWQRTRL